MESWPEGVASQYWFQCAGWAKFGPWAEGRVLVGSKDGLDVMSVCCQDGGVEFGCRERVFVLEGTFERGGAGESSNLLDQGCRFGGGRTISVNIRETSFGRWPLFTSVMAMDGGGGGGNGGARDSPWIIIASFSSASLRGVKLRW